MDLPLLGSQEKVGKVISPEDCTDLSVCMSSTSASPVIQTKIKNEESEFAPEEPAPSPVLRPTPIFQLAFRGYEEHCMLFSLVSGPLDSAEEQDPDHKQAHTGGVRKEGARVLGQAAQGQGQDAELHQG
jgi:hypothetical protein